MTASPVNGVPMDRVNAALAYVEAEGDGETNLPPVLADMHPTDRFILLGAAYRVLFGSTTTQGDTE